MLPPNHLAEEPAPRTSVFNPSSPGSAYAAALLGDPVTHPETIEAALVCHLRAIEKIEAQFATGQLSEEALVELSVLGHEILNEIQVLQLQSDLRRLYVRPSAKLVCA